MSPPLRCPVLAASAIGLLAYALASGAQDLPPIPNKVLPSPSAPAAVHSLVSPSTGRSYSILVVPEERDSDEGEEAELETADSSTAAPAPAAARKTSASSESFKGTARKAAKLSVANAPMQTFSDLRDLLATLPSKKSMVGRTPKIRTDANSNRVAEEDRNVSVRAWLYAASRENDRDYHLILGRAPGATPQRYMTMEISGLPPTNAASFPALKGARDSFNAFFGSRLPGTSYDFYNPPIPVQVQGSLFFDMSHATGTPPGPQSLRPNMPTIWEVHPITGIAFEPSP